MKLNELFLTPDQLKYKQTKQTIAPKLKRLSQTDNSRQRIGGGVYASAYASEKDPGSVDKIADPSEIRSLSTDAYYQYLDAIARNDRIANNPFFPKVFNLETFRGKDGKYTYKVNMEKLAPLKTLSLEEITRIGSELFTDFAAVYKHARTEYGIKDTRPTGDAHTDNDKQQTKLFLAVRAFADCFQQAAYSDSPPTNIKNAYLKQALMFIRNILKRNSSFAPDLHQGNMMVRRGPFAPQIVITDPISGGGNDSAPASTPPMGV
jgi:hypothetical protein